MQITATLDPEVQQYVESLVAPGDFPDIEEAINAILHRDREAKQRYIEQVRRQLEEAEQSGGEGLYDADNLDAFWTDIEELSDRMLWGEVPMRENSAALPPQN